MSTPLSSYIKIFVRIHALFISAVKKNNKRQHLHSIYYLLTTVLNSLHLFTNVRFTTLSYHFHFLDELTEAQRDKVTFPGPQVISHESGK
jgi:hypothetical protein